ncbi:MAG: hypothetical protein MJA27_23525 [Pseudanabaenales cyanobacterium]|nr:hypothetical protein [Pseudanabaenales cyanobacterium]
MKALSKVWILFFLTLAACWLIVFKVPVGEVNLLSQKPVLAKITPIPISLPSDAEVQLRSSNETRSGKVIGLDSQQLTLQRSSETTSIPLNTVDRVVYDQSSPFYRASGEIVIRGGQTSPNGPQDTWGPIPLNDFGLKDVSTGQAGVVLDSVLSSTELRGITVVARNSTYVTDEMRFDLQQGTMTLVVTPY